MKENRLLGINIIRYLNIRSKMFALNLNMEISFQESLKILTITENTVARKQHVYVTHKIFLCPLLRKF